VRIIERVQFLADPGGQVGVELAEPRLDALCGG
jgi:hypothetical protein